MSLEEQDLRYCIKCKEPFFWIQSISAFDVCDECFIPFKPKDYYTKEADG